MMNGDELRAAATVRAYLRTEASHAIPTDVFAAMLAAADALAPADDAEAVTADWLRGLGFWKRGDSELCSPRTGRWMLIHDSDPATGFSSVWNLSFPGCQQSLGYDLPTRGHVRRLLAALGITPGESR